MWGTLIVSTSVALAGPRPPTLSELSASLEEYNAGAHFALPELDSASLETLLSGDVVRLLERSTTPGVPSRAVGLVLSDVPRDQVWVACQDTHYVQNSSVAESVLESSDANHVTWFGLLDLPSPFTDRAWVVRVVNNLSLSESSEERSWEHYWELHPDASSMALEAARAGRIPGVETADVDRAIFMPMNQGAWLMMDLPGGYSLLGYHSSTELAGNLPTGLVMQFVHAQLGAMLQDIVDRGRDEVPGHYDSEHSADVLGGNGAPVSRFP